MRDPKCKFCRILAGELPASIVYQDSEMVALMNTRAVNKGECMVIPREHIDHFTDIPDGLSARMMVVAQTIGRKIRELYGPERIGYVVHGYGVPHAHLIIVPQNDPCDITSRKFVRVVDGELVFGVEDVPLISRDELDAIAKELAASWRPCVHVGKSPES